MLLSPLKEKIIPTEHVVIVASNSEGEMSNEEPALEEDNGLRSEKPSPAIKFYVICGHAKTIDFEYQRLREDISSLERRLDQAMDERIEKLVALVYHGYQVAPLSSNVTQSLQEIERKLVSVIVDNLKNMQTAVLKGLIDFIGKSNHNEGSEDQTVDGDGRTDEPPSADRRDCPSNNTHAEDADGRINEVLLDLNEVLDDLPHVITL